MCLEELFSMQTDATFLPLIVATSMVAQEPMIE